MSKVLARAAQEIDAQLGNALPPKVDGDVNGEVKVTVNEVALRGETEDVAVEIEWWGQPGKDTMRVLPFVRKEGKLRTAGDRRKYESSVVFPIKTSGDRFVTYLRDAGALRFRVLRRGKYEDVMGICSVAFNVDLSSSALEDGPIDIEGTFSINSAESGSGKKIGSIDLEIFVGVGPRYSKLLQSLNHLLEDADEEPLRLGPMELDNEISGVTRESETNDPLLSSFLMNEVLANSDTANMLPTSPQPVTQHYRPKTPEKQPSVPHSPIKKNERALRIIKSLRESSEKIPKRTQRVISQRNSPKENVEVADPPANIDRTTMIENERGHEVKQQILQRLLSKASSLKEEMDRSLDDHKSWINPNSYLLLEKDPINSKLPDFLGSLTSATPVDLQPFVSSSSPTVQTVEAATISVRDLALASEVLPSTQRGDLKIEIALKLPQLRASLEELENLDFQVFKVIEKSFSSGREPKRSMSTWQSKGLSAPKSSWRSYPFTAEATWPATFSSAEIDRWSRGKLQIKLNHVVKENGELLNLPIAVGSIPLRFTLVSDNLSYDSSIQLFSVNDFKLQKSSIGKVDLHISLSINESSNKALLKFTLPQPKYSHASLLPQNVQNVQLPLPPVPSQSEDVKQKGFANWSATVQLKSITPALPNGCVKFKSTPSEYQQLSTSHDTATVDFETSVKVLILEVYSEPSTFLGIGRLRLEESQGGTFTLDIKDPFSGNVCNQVHLHITPIRTLESTETRTDDKIVKESSFESMVLEPAKLIESGLKSSEETTTSIHEKSESEFEESDTEETEVKVKESTKFGEQKEDGKNDVEGKVNHIPIRTSDVSDQHVFVIELANRCYRRDVSGLMIKYRFPEDQESSSESFHSHELWWDGYSVSNNTIGRHLIETGSDQDILDFLPPPYGKLKFSIIGPPLDQEDGDLVQLDGFCEVPGFELIGLVEEASATDETSSAGAHIGGGERGLYRERAKARKKFQLPIQKRSQVIQEMRVRSKLKFLEVIVHYQRFEVDTKITEDIERLAGAITQSVDLAPVTTRLPRDRLEVAWVKLCVQIGTVEKLQGLARAVARLNSEKSFLYLAAAVGVNPTVQVELKLPESDDFSLCGLNFTTHLLARTFDPIFNEEGQFSIQMDPETLQALSKGTAKLTLWHTHVNPIAVDSCGKSDAEVVLLGQAILPLKELLLSSSGIRSQARFLHPQISDAEQSSALCNIAIFFDHHRKLAEIFPFEERTAGIEEIDVHHRTPPNTFAAKDATLNEVPGLSTADIAMKSLEKENEEELIVLETTSEPLLFEDHFDESPFSGRGHETSHFTSSRSEVENIGNVIDSAAKTLLADSFLDSIHSMTYSVLVRIENALHLPMIEIGGKLQPPRPYVTFKVENERVCETYFTQVAKNSPTSNPLWEEQHSLRILPRSLKMLRLHVWHRSHWGPENDVGSCLSSICDQTGIPGTDHDPYLSTLMTRTSSKVEPVFSELDTYIGTAVVDISTLFVGLGTIHGWYHIIDNEQRRVGQIKVFVKEEGSDTIEAVAVDASASTDIVQLAPSMEVSNQEISYGPDSELSVNTGVTSEASSMDLRVPHIEDALENLKWVDDQLRVRLGTLFESSTTLRQEPPSVVDYAFGALREHQQEERTFLEEDNTKEPSSPVSLTTNINMGTLCFKAEDTVTVGHDVEHPQLSYGFEAESSEVEEFDHVADEDIEYFAGEKDGECGVKVVAENGENLQQVNSDEAPAEEGKFDHSIFSSKTEVMDVEGNTSAGISSNFQETFLGEEGNESSVKSGSDCGNEHKGEDDENFSEEIIPTVENICPSSLSDKETAKEKSNESSQGETLFHVGESKGSPESNVENEDEVVAGENDLNLGDLDAVEFAYCDQALDIEDGPFTAPPPPPPPMNHSNTTMSFYNQLSEDPFSSGLLPSIHVCTSVRKVNEDTRIHELTKISPTKRSWMDPETARIARILRGEN